MPTLTEMPMQLRAGTTLALLLTLPDYPADEGWTVTLRVGSVSKTSTASGQQHAITVSATESAALTTGATPWSLQASKSGEVWDVASNVIEVLAAATASASDQLSYEEKALAAIRAMRLGIATSTQRSFQVEGRAVEHWSHQELAALEREYQARVNAQRSGNSWPTPTLISFVQPGPEFPPEWPILPPGGVS